MFTAASFTIAKIWKQSKCPPINVVKKMMRYVNIYSGILFSHEEERNPAICNNMDGLREYYAKFKKSDRER